MLFHLPALYMSNNAGRFPPLQNGSSKMLPVSQVFLLSAPPTHSVRDAETSAICAFAQSARSNGNTERVFVISATGKLDY
jgi:hypothetical protein